MLAIILWGWLEDTTVGHSGPSPAVGNPLRFVSQKILQKFTNLASSPTPSHRSWLESLPNEQRQNKDHHYVLDLPQPHQTAAASAAYTTQPTQRSLHNRI